jgi:hypothetical protein
MRSIGMVLALLGIAGALALPAGCKKDTPPPEPAEDAEPVGGRFDDVPEPPPDDDTQSLPDVDSPLDEDDTAPLPEDESAFDDGVEDSDDEALD